MNKCMDILKDIVILLEFILSESNNLNDWRLNCINNIIDKIEALDD